jgi:hypothetical protein
MIYLFTATYLIIANHEAVEVFLIYSIIHRKKNHKDARIKFLYSRRVSLFER